MPLVLDPGRLPEAVLRELLDSLRQDLVETEELVRSPRGRVLDPASLETAAELLRSARAILDGPAPVGAVELGARANLAYAVLLAAIDLVKSHTDVPRVPPPRPVRPPSG